MIFWTHSNPLHSSPHPNPSPEGEGQSTNIQIITPFSFRRRGQGDEVKILKEGMGD
jgi:hypothetical protein